MAGDARANRHQAQKSWGVPLAFIGLALTSACSSLPRAAPSANEILKDAPSRFGSPLRIVDLATRKDAPPEQIEAAKPACANPDLPAQAGRIAIGDELLVSTYEIGVGLFSSDARQGITASGTSDRGARRADMRLVVEEDGAVALPFLGRVRVEGFSPHQAQSALLERLRTRSQSPDLLLTVEPGPRQAVLLQGDVKNPGRVPLSHSGEHVLDAIALAGGLRGDASDYVAIWTREALQCAIRLDETDALDPDNLLLAGGDRIEIVRDVRQFTALGASRAVAVLPFNGPRLSLIEAIGRAGGPLDSEADPTGVFLFRFETDENGTEIPTIYRLNLVDPRSYFVGQRFMMRDGDVVFVASARSNRLTKFIQLLNLLVTPAVSGRILVR